LTNTLITVLRFLYSLCTTAQFYLLLFLFLTQHLEDEGFLPY